MAMYSYVQTTVAWLRDGEQNKLLEPPTEPAGTREWVSNTVYTTEAGGFSL
jgi:hypothetical protein